MPTWRPPLTPTEQVAAAAAVPARVFCHACYRGWVDLVACPIPPYGVVSACADPVTCRQHAIKIGIYKFTGIVRWSR
jgi:hypothetical protein